MGIRQVRLAEQIKDILGSCFQGGQMSDPRLQAVAITAVKLSGDLQIASVYYRTFGETEGAAVDEALNRAAGYLRAQLASALDMRRIPNLKFYFDKSIERGAKIERLLGDIDQDEPEKGEK